MSELEPQAYLTQLRADLSRLDAVLGEAPEDAWARPVPGCPDWNLDGLIRHLGGVHRMVLGAIADGAPSRSDQHDPGAAVSGTALAGWLREGGARLLAALDTDPDRPAWTFFRPAQTVGFWQRRQAQENLVHRLDAEETLGCPTPLPPALAADGVAEIVDVMIPLRATLLTLPAAGVRLVATDTGQSWVLGGAAEPAGEAAARAEDLLLALWGRRDPDAVLTVAGDVEAVRRVLAQPIAP